MMRGRITEQPDRRVSALWGTGLLAVCLATAGIILPPPAKAQTQQASEEALNAGIVIFRKVPRRPATRPGIPAPPFRVRTSPAPEVLGALRTQEFVGEVDVLSDAEAARVRSGSPLAVPRTSVPPATSGFAASIRRSIQSTGGSAVGLPGVGSAGDMGVAAGNAVRDATGGIAGTVRGALGLRTR